ncbi:MAG TPA: hypothetical protein VLA43_07955 [Longimicrobiales bacterium]|nr:hypothetical protein [Longimicrobiales bacterium]
MDEPRSRSATGSGSGRSRRRDLDGAARARLLKVAAWSLFPAVFMGGAVAVKAGPLAGLGVFLLVAVVAGGGSLAITEVVGRAAGHLLDPSTGRRHREYSAPASLAARGLYAEAVSAYEAAALEFPEDPAPCLAAARLCAGPLADADQALRWFRQARTRGLGGGEERVVIREMVEVAERGGNGLKAAPDLARYVEERAGTPEGDWAMERLAQLKQTLRATELPGASTGRGPAG